MPCYLNNLKNLHSVQILINGICCIGFSVKKMHFHKDGSKNVFPRESRSPLTNDLSRSNN